MPFKPVADIGNSLFTLQNTRTQHQPALKGTVLIPYPFHSPTKSSPPLPLSSSFSLPLLHPHPHAILSKPLPQLLHPHLHALSRILLSDLSQVRLDIILPRCPTSPILALRTFIRRPRHGLDLDQWTAAFTACVSCGVDGFRLSFVLMAALQGGANPDVFVRDVV